MVKIVPLSVSSPNEDRAQLTCTIGVRIQICLSYLTSLVGRVEWMWLVLVTIVGFTAGGPSRGPFSLWTHSGCHEVAELNSERSRSILAVVMAFVISF
jgi:hypothetical protein